MFSSTIIPTIGRPSLERAVLSVFSQAFPYDLFEVIVVNDSGKPLPKADWQSDDKVKVIHTQRHERSFARNTGAAIARGQYLHFLDDDDFLVPGALEAIWALSHKCDADWLYGCTQMLDRQGNPHELLDHRIEGNCFIQTMAGEWIPLQSSWVKARSFFEVGGFNNGITGPEDTDLLKRIALRGNLARVGTVVSCVLGGCEGSTTDHNTLHTQSHSVREGILENSHCYRRLIDSIRSSPSHDAYWHGRLTRIYLTSLIWNIRERRYLTAVSRLLYSITSIFNSWASLIAPEYWRAVIRNHISGRLN